MTMLLFNKRDTHLQIVIAIAAFSMNVDIAAGFSLESSYNSSTEAHVQEIGQAERDGTDTFTILINRCSSKNIKDYANNTDQCRHLLRFGNFISYMHISDNIK